MFAVGLGHEFPAVVAVIGTFFGGMALGGYFSPRILDRFGAKSFAFLELIVGAWGLLTPFAIHFANDLALHLESRAAGFFLSFLALFPSVIAMGASLPAMSAMTNEPRKIAAAYAANTCGGAAGCLLAAFVLMPRFGLKMPIGFCALGNFIAAVLAWKLRPTQIVPSRPSTIPPRLAAAFFISGFLALAFETLGVRLLSLSLENTVFSFAMILAVYLAGQAVGASAQRGTALRPRTLLPPAVVAAFFLFRWSGDIYDAVRSYFGERELAVVCAEMLTTMAIFAPPTFFMGALFTELAEEAGESSLGAGLLWNSVGAATGAIGSALLIPSFGLFGMLLGCAVGYLLLAGNRCRLVFGPALLLLVYFYAGANPLMRVPPGGRIKTVREGAMATVSVIETPDGNSTLFVNNRFQMGGTSALIPELRHGHIPLLLHPAPKRALFLGLGTGISMSAALAHPNLETDGVELLSEVTSIMPLFFTNALTSPLAPANRGRARVIVADARRFVRQTTNRYDVIVADLFHPAADGAGFLYTREHFEHIRECLAPGGLFCQWLPLHQLDLETFRVITRTYLEVFPHADVWLLRFNVDAPVVGLTGWRDGWPNITDKSYETRFADPKLGPELRRVALGDTLRLFGGTLANSVQLDDFCRSARINTDDFPIVLFQAPAFSYQRAAPPYTRLMTLLDQFESKEPPSTKLQKFRAARNVYLRALVLEANGDRDKALDGYVESAQLSEDFTSGYAQALTIASAQMTAHPTLARNILERLIEAQPNRPVAREMLERVTKSAKASP